MISNFTIFYLSNIYFRIFLHKYNTFLHFHMILAAPFALKNYQNYLMQSLPLYTSCLFSMLLNQDIVDIEKPYGICSLTFFVD